MFPLVITVGNRFPLLITVKNTFSLFLTVKNTFLLLITVGKNHGSSFFLKKHGTSEISSMSHRSRQNNNKAIKRLCCCRVYKKVKIFSE